MSQTLVKPEVRQQLKPSQILRNTPVQQCVGKFTDYDGRYCVLGALLHHFGYNESVPEQHFISKVENIGIRGHVWTTIVEMNDSGSSFTQIADWLERQGL